MSSPVVLSCEQKTEYEMGISDWSSGGCSSDLRQGSLQRASAWARACSERLVDEGVGPVSLVVEDAGVDAHEHVYGMAEAAGHLGRRDSRTEHHRGVGRTRWPKRVGDRKSTRLNSSH